MAGLHHKFHLILKLRWFNTGRKQNSKEQEVEKIFCVVETTSPSPAFLQNSSQISTDTASSAGIRTWCLPQKNCVDEFVAPVLQKRVLKASLEELEAVSPCFQNKRAHSLAFLKKETAVGSGRKHRARAKF